MVKKATGLAAIAVLMSTAAPANAQLVVGQLLKEHEVQPGATTMGVLTVTNTSPKPQEAKLYLTDYAITSDGKTLYGDPGSTPRSNALWIALGPSRIVVPPNQTVEIPYAVRVPVGQHLSGTYWSMLMIEGLPPGSEESGMPAAGPRATVGLSVSFRTAVQIATHIDSGAIRDAKFDTPRVSNEPGTTALQFELRNTGNRGFSPDFRLELYADDGSHVKTLTARRGLCYPGMSLRQRFDLGRLPAGKYRAIVTADAGGDAVFGAQYTFKL
jgi:hypothetical protein